MRANRSALRRITDLILGIGLCVFLFFVGLVLFLAYGQIEYPKHFQANVPMTNMQDVESLFGKPVSISSYADGTICWNYTHWWSGTAKVYFKTNGDFYRTFTEF